MLNSIRQNAILTITSSQDLNSSKVRKEWTVLTTLSILAIFIILFMVWGHYKDSQQAIASSYSKALNKNLSKIAPIRNRKKKIQKLIAATDSNDLAIIEESIPRVFSSKPFVERLAEEVKQHHRWLGVLFHFSDTFPRSLRVLSISTNVIIMLFIQSITYNLTNPDDGSCEVLKSENACNLPLSQFGMGQKKCFWKSDLSSKFGGKCIFIEPSDSLTIVLFVALFSALISTPIALFLNLMIQSVLSAKLKDSVISIADETETISQFKRANNKISKSFVLFRETGHLFKSQKSQNELTRLSTELKSYRTTLGVVEKIEFDGTLVL
jgi:hypothetical protein